MATTFDDAVLDAALQKIIDEADTITYTETAANNYADATTLKGSGGSKLADNDARPDDFTKSDGVQSGRRLSFKFRQFTPSVAGTVDHVAFVDDDNSNLIAVLPTQSDVNVPQDKVGFAYNQDAVDVLEIRDPS